MSVRLASPTPDASDVPDAVDARRAGSVDPDAFKAAFRRHAAGVVVITADAGRRPVGFTATSLASVSLDPPLLSFALATTASSWPTVAIAPTLVVNFLADDQHRLATTFATSGIDRFAAPTAWSRLVTGEPLLDDAPGHLRAEVVDRHPVGDHHIVVARVTHAWSAEPHAPLVYHAGTYGRLQTS
ncbi:flavin reductase family protein [Jiangella mangrovi]|uniref:Flavin reductase (DIM6/NTAB) family NADH-FMN oxidoreductase RutF n=1 Tax=Jiangella mangrovi TaxID=1524084 RepID=A0A7W9GWQ3_9ACTN|nr:flavin reductase family protein [Jiangella mangrovi]MBB5791076.1 flavin reductase (DIM6/NTAB) family NADH-FMN oxidoreductase RutF [Jiangella mangrovi]